MSDVKKVVMGIVCGAAVLMGSVFVSADTASPVPVRTMFGIQLGTLSGATVASPINHEGFWGATIGVSNNAFAMSAEWTRTFHFLNQDSNAVHGFYWFYGLEAFVAFNNPVRIGAGIPIGLVYQFAEGPDFMFELAPMLVGSGSFAVEVHPALRMVIPF
ncbi:MAG: hypothetical protein AAB066_03930 [Candidatus Margulisiibacteriota bacterium]